MYKYENILKQVMPSKEKFTRENIVTMWNLCVSKNAEFQVDFIGKIHL
jgi:hypothetical protein